MRDRIKLFKQEFLDFSGLSDQTVRELIRVYDRNKNNLSQQSSSPSIAIIGGLMVWGTGIFFTSSAGHNIVDISGDNDPV